MMNQTPRDLQYSTAVKPVSIASTAQTRKFLPITSGIYSPTSNNIIRIPINSNAFIDLKNSMLRYKLINGTTSAVFLDGSSASFISRLNIISPDGSPLETIDNYNGLLHALSQLERGRDNYEGITNILEGTSNGNPRISISSAAGPVLNFAVDGVDVGTLTINGAANDTITIGDYRFVYNGAATSLTAFYKDISGGAAVLIGAAGEVTEVPGFSFQTAALLANLRCNGVIVGVAGGFVEAYASDFNIKNQSEALIGATGSRFFSHNLLSTLTKLDVLYPSFAIGGGGVIIEITLAPSSEVFQVSKTIGTAPAYTIDSVELIAPVIQYPDSVVQSFKQMLQAQGSVSMSSVSFQSFTNPVPASPGSLTVSLAVRARSLKALYFFFKPNGLSDNFSYPRASARECPATMNYQLRVGSQFFPASVVQFSSTTGVGVGGLTEAMIELEKSVSKLSDIRHGSVMNARNFVLTQGRGGTSLFGIDLEASAISYLENGINTAENSLTMYLEITNLTFNAQDGVVNPVTLATTPGVIQIYALYDNTLSILPNGSVVATK